VRSNAAVLCTVNDFSRTDIAVPAGTVKNDQALLDVDGR